MTAMLRAEGYPVNRKRVQRHAADGHRGAGAEAADDEAGAGRESSRICCGA